MSFLHSHISIDVLVVDVFFVTFRWKETTEIENGESDCMTLQMQ